jgi:hypothetical protein
MEMATAEDDSLTMAFFLLKYDFDLSVATSEAREAALENRIADIKADQKRTIITVIITAVVTGTLYHLSRTVD